METIRGKKEKFTTEQWLIIGGSVILLFLLADKFVKIGNAK